MTPERWQQVKRLLESALERGPAERAALLDDACKDDPALRGEVESLIASHEQAESFFDSPAFEIAAGLMAGDKATLVGRRIGHYKFLSQIGQGGMGEVYLAHDSRLNRRVALKLLPAYFTKDEQHVRRFEQEARAASTLNHPNILVIFEIGQVEDVHFIATEFIEGQTLRKRMASAELSADEVLDVAIQTASALVAAHKAGIVHRDIKPENIMLRPDGYVKVLDFGLVKLTEHHRRADDTEAVTLAHVSTDAGIVMGTVNYMSPEQARGQKVDERTDIFSLGVVIYEMAASRQPFAGETKSDVIAAILTREPPPLASRSKQIPEALELIVKKALVKERENRYQTAAEMLTDLRGLKKRLEFKAQRGSKFKINKVVLFASILVLALIAVALIAFLAPRGKPVQEETAGVLKTSQMTSWPGLDAFPSLSPDGNSIAYSSDHNGSYQIYIKQLTPGAREIQLTSEGKENFSPAWSPDGQRIAYYSKDRGGIWVMPATGGHSRQLTEFGARPAWSRDGSMIAFQSSGLSDLGASARTLPPSTVWVISSQGGDARQVTQVGNPLGGHGAPAWSPDGKRIAFESGEFNMSSIWSVSINGDDLKRITEQSSLQAYNPIYSPGGESIYYSETTNGVWKVRVSQTSGEPVGKPVRIAGAAPTFIRHLTISADGKKIAYSAMLRASNLWSAPLSTSSSAITGTPVQVTRDTSSRNNHPAFSPDGRKIAYTSYHPGTGGDIWMMDADGKNPIQVTTNPAGEAMPSWFPAMDQIAFISDRDKRQMIYASNLANAKERLLFDIGEEIEYARLSPNGKQFAFNRKKDGPVNICTIPLEGGQPVQLTFDNEMMGFPCWSPDGQYIAFQVKRGEDTHIAIIPSSGGTLTQLTFDRGQSWPHSWSPDGDKIVFAGFRKGYWNVWWISRSTGEQKQLTNYSKLNAFVRYPAWSPLNNQIVYEYTETTGNIWVIELR